LGECRQIKFAVHGTERVFHIVGIAESAGCRHRHQEGGFGGASPPSGFAQPFVSPASSDAQGKARIYPSSLGSVSRRRSTWPEIVFSR
jgi:hypothetical protein